MDRSTIYRIGEKIMGSGSRFQISLQKGFGLAVFADRFPHQVSINLLIGCISIYIGFGKGYDE